MRIDLLEFRPQRLPFVRAFETSVGGVETRTLVLVTVVTPGRRAHNLQLASRPQFTEPRDIAAIVPDRVQRATERRLATSARAA